MSDEESSDGVDEPQNESPLGDQEPCVSDDETSDPDSSNETPEIDRYWPPPTSESVELAGSYSSKTVSALCLNHAGSRFTAGGNDHEVRIWDFEALDPKRPESICNVQPCDQTVIKSLDFTNDDELILVISGGCQAVIIAKDGVVAKQYQCPKGDQYISDMANTKGHNQMLNDGCWNPKDKEAFITCSNDGTVRIWDLNKLSQQKTVIKTRSPASGLKAVPNVCKYSRDSLSIVAGCNDGSVMFWDTRRKYITTSACIKNAHLKGSEITGIDFSYGLNKICTRSEDETCKIWDCRQFKEPLAKTAGLMTLYSNADCSFSPDDKFVTAGTSCTKSESGQLHFLSAEDLSIKSSIEAPKTSVIRSRWHPKINHIIYTCSNGSVFITYDKERSMAGCLTSEQVSNRGTKRKKYMSQRDSNHSAPMKIITPHSLPLFREDQSSSSFAKLRQDPKRSYKPEMPMTGASQGGRVKPAGSTLSSYIAKNLAKPVETDMDIRERILRHAEEAARDPFWIKPTQPNEKHSEKGQKSGDGQQ